MKEIVYISSIPWNFSWHRQQEMMSKMAEKENKILFVQPCQKAHPFNYSINNIKKNVWVLNTPGLPYERCFSFINTINGKISKHYILKAMQVIGMENPIVWLDRVHGFDFKFFSLKYDTVYDLVDEILSFGRMRNEKMLIKLENQVLNSSKLLISSSQTLLERKIRQSGREGVSKFIPNGVDTTRFSGEKTETFITDRAFPRIGFIGDISKRRIDFELVKELASRNKKWEFIFIGPGNPNDKTELKEENIYVYDAVPGEMIPSIIESFDIGIIPYKVDKNDMDYIFPRKACEYLAAGKSVVSTPLSEIKDLSPYIRIANNAIDFEKKIQESFEDTNIEDKKKFAKKFDWDTLTQEIMAELSKW